MENASLFAAEYNKAVDEVSRATNWIARWCTAGGELIGKNFKKEYSEASEEKLSRTSSRILEDLIDGFRKGGSMMMTERGTGRKVPMPAMSEIDIAKMLEGESGNHFLNMVHLNVFRSAETNYLKALRTRDQKLQQMITDYEKANPSPADFDPRLSMTADPVIEIESAPAMSKWPAKKAKRK